MSKSTSPAQVELAERVQGVVLAQGAPAPAEALTPLTPDQLHLATEMELLPSSDSEDAAQAGEDLPGGAAGGGDDGHGHSGGAQAGMRATVLNFVNSIVGAGVIGLPYALKEAGLLVGALLILCVGAFTNFSVRHMITVGTRKGVRSYSSLVATLFGKPGAYIVAAAMFIFAYGAMVAYTIIFGDTVSSVVHAASGADGAEPSEAVRRWVIAIGSVLCTLPLALVRHMATLSRTSGLSLLAVAFIALAMVVRAWAGVPASRLPEPGTPDAQVQLVGAQLFPAIGVVAFAFVCQHSSFSVFNSLRDPTIRRWKLTTHASVLASLVASAAVGMTGYMTFTGWVEPNVLNNYAAQDTLMNVARAGFAATMLLTYPMEVVVARLVIMKMVLKVQPHHASRRQHVLVSVALWATAALIALATSKLGFVLEISGALAGCTLGFIGPAAIGLAVSPYHLVPWQVPAGSRWAACKRNTPFWSLLIFGLVSLVVSTTLTLVKLASSGAE